MRRKRSHLVLAGLLALGCALPLLASEEPPDVQIVPMRLVTSTSLDLGFGSCQWLYPLDVPEEALSEPPVLKSGKPIYYAALYGDSKDRTFTFVIDESGGIGKGYDTLFVDADNDNRIDPEAERFPFHMSTTSKGQPIRIELVVSSGGKTAPYRVDFTAFLYSDEKHPEKKVHANLRDASYYVGEARLNGKPVRIAIADLDSNGLFNDAEMGLFKGDRLFVDLDNDGDFRNDASADPYGGYPYGAWTRIDGRWYSIVASPDGGRIEIRQSTPTFGEVEAPPVIAVAVLRSSTQSCRLSFVEGTARGIAGSYSIRTVTLSARDEDGKTWETTGEFAVDRRLEVTIAVDEAARILAGPPLGVEAKVSQKATALEIELSITGSAGESYRWRGRDPDPRPGFTVLDEAGGVVYSGTFEYG